MNSGFLLAILLVTLVSMVCSTHKTTNSISSSENFFTMLNTTCNNNFPHQLQLYSNNLKLINIFYEGLKSFSEYFQHRTCAASILSPSNISRSIFVFKNTSSPKQYLMLRSQNSHKYFLQQPKFSIASFNLAPRCVHAGLCNI